MRTYRRFISILNFLTSFSITIILYYYFHYYQSYHLFIIWQGKSERFNWLFLGRDFAIRTVSVETVISCVFFVFESRQTQLTSMVRVPYNKLRTNLASSSRTGEYWPSVVFVRTSLRSVRTATTSGQYSPVRPSRSVSKRLIFIFIFYLLRGYFVLIHCIIIIFFFFLIL